MSSSMLFFTPGPDSIDLDRLPTILLQAVLLSGDRTHDGHLIEAVAPAWREILKLIREDEDNLFKIPPRKLEELIAGAYKREGFDRVILTPSSGDYGRDIIAEKSGLFGLRFVDQVKAYKPGHRVTAEEVRALGHVLAADRNANKGIVTTTSTFAPRIAEDPYIKPYLPKRIELIDGPQLVDRLQRLADD